MWWLKRGQRSENSTKILQWWTVSWSRGAWRILLMLWPSRGPTSMWRMPLWSPWSGGPHRARCGWWAASPDTSPWPKDSGCHHHYFGTKRQTWSPETRLCCSLWCSPDTSTSCCCRPSGVLSPEWCCSECGWSGCTCTEVKRTEKHHTAVVHHQAVFTWTFLLLVLVWDNNFIWLTFSFIM